MEQEDHKNVGRRTERGKKDAPAETAALTTLYCDFMTASSKRASKSACWNPGLDPESEEAGEGTAGAASIVSKSKCLLYYACIQLSSD
jgi:hypothetical protein